jgi:hypothetical protein
MRRRRAGKSGRRQAWPVYLFRKAEYFNILSHTQIRPAESSDDEENDNPGIKIKKLVQVCSGLKRGEDLCVWGTLSAARVTGYAVAGSDTRMADSYLI